MIRLDALEQLGRGLKGWCVWAVPWLCLAGLLSDRPIHFGLFCIGWKYLRRSLCKFSSTSSSSLSTSSSSLSTSASSSSASSSSTGFRDNSNNGTIDKTGTVRTTGSNSRCGIDMDSIEFLTTSPSAILSNVTSYLHPKDAVSFDSVLRYIPVTVNNNCKNSSSSSRYYHNFDEVVHDMWRSLWYRDYGNVLLRWKVSRQAFYDSLSSQEEEDGTDNGEYCLEEKLSNKINTIRETREFYFLFGECYIDYLLANNNTRENCYMGLQGHIFDFTHFAEYHPGLIDPILKECGGDATYFFEDRTPHSSVARNIARSHLCAVINRNLITESDSSSSINASRCGLELVLSAASLASSYDKNNNFENNSGNNNKDEKEDVSKLKEILRLSNSRPLQQPSSSSSSSILLSTSSTKTKVNDKKEQNWWMSHILPRRRIEETRRPPTLLRIRNKFQHEKQLFQEEKFFHNNGSIKIASRVAALLPFGSSWSSSSRHRQFRKMSASSSSSQFQQNNNNNNNNNNSANSDKMEHSKSSTSSMTRLYYDPFRQEWISWDPNNPEKQ